MINKHPEQQLEPDFIRTSECEIDGYLCTNCCECRPTCDEDIEHYEEECKQTTSEETLIDIYTWLIRLGQ